MISVIAVQKQNLVCDPRGVRRVTRARYHVTGMRARVRALARKKQNNSLSSHKKQPTAF